MAVPEYGIDQIIGVKTGSFTIGSSTFPIGNPTLATQSIATGFGDTCYFDGIFSTDSGTTWNQFGVHQPQAGPTFQTVSCYGYTLGNNLVLKGINYTSSSYTIQYKVALIAKNNQGNITPTPTNEILVYNSSANYQKIKTKGSVAFSPVSGVQNSALAMHNLGYIPKVRAFYIPSQSSTSTSLGIFTLPANVITTFDMWAPLQIRIDDTTVTFFDDEGNVTPPSPPTVPPGTIDYRIYLDA